MDDHRFLKAILRTDLASFIGKAFETVDGSQPYLHNWHIDLTAYYLEKAYHREITRLIITLPPRNLKSICASVAFPAWVFGNDPTAQIICASYSSDLAGKHARDSRAVMEDDWYRRAFPKTRINRNKTAEDDFETTARGCRFSTSVAGTMTGRGGGILIIDDPIKPYDALSDAKRESVNQWYDSTAYTRLNDKRDGVIILIMQRVHVDDLVAHVLEKEDWVHLNLPAIAQVPERFELEDGRIFSREPGDVLHPKREPMQVLDQARENLGRFFFEAQYQQSPVPIGGNMIKWSWFRQYRDLPSPGPHDQIIQSWDTASKAEELNDYSVCTTWQEIGNSYYLVDVFRMRLEYPGLKIQVIAQAERFKADVVLIEDKGSGTHLVQDLNHEGIIRPIAILPEGDKVTRMAAQSAKIEAGYVYLPEKAPWLQDFQTEILQFPNGRFDDQVDSLSQFLGWASEPSEAVFHVS